MIAAQARRSTGVEAATGFTFEQFRRTVLLAQGDVDAFSGPPEGSRGVARQDHQHRRLCRDFAPGA